MKRLFFFLSVIALFYTAPAIGQVKYKTENLTHELSPVKVSVSIINFENILTPVTAGLLVEGHLNDKLFYNIQLRQGYIRNLLIDRSDLMTTQKESKGTVFEAGIDLPFSDKIEAGGSVRVSTSFNYEGMGITEKFFIASCDVRKYWAFSAGVMQYNRPKYINSDSSQYIISGNEEIKAPTDKYTHFNQSTTGGFIGIVRRKIKKAFVSHDGVSYRRFYSTKFIAQMLVGSTSVEDIVYNNKAYKIDNANQMPLGYRIGWQWDQMGVVSGFEFGKMPGVKLDTPVEADALTKIFSNNPFLNYVRFTFHFTVFNSDKTFRKK